MRIFKIKQVGQSARILPIHVKEEVKRGKSTSFFHFRKRQELGHEKSGNERTKNAPQAVYNQILKSSLVDFDSPTRPELAPAVGLIY